MEPKPNSRKKANESRKPPTYTVSFRVDAYHLARLEKGAAGYGISVHEYARQRLTELLERQDEAHILAEVAEVKVGVNALREDLARALEVVLVNTTSAESSAVRRWIDSNLRRE